MPPRKRSPRRTPPPKAPPRTTRVGSYSRRDGTKVKSHNRELAWKQARAAWAGAGVSGITTMALIAEFGLSLVSTIFLILTALLTWLAVWAGQKANGNKRKMRAQMNARKVAPKKPAPRKRH
jgi:hypothetical protein